MNELAVIQAAQTITLAAVVLILVYTVNLLRTEIKRAVSTLHEVILNQKQLDQNVRRSWERIDAIEARERGQR